MDECTELSDFRLQRCAIASMLSVWLSIQYITPLALRMRGTRLVPIRSSRVTPNVEHTSVIT